LLACFKSEDAFVKPAYSIAVAACCFCLSACSEDRNFTIFGYSTRPNYDTSIHTVRVPILKNLTQRHGLEFDLTKAVVREIELKTPYKVVSADCDADTELIGTIISYNKNILNRNQLNEVREAETTLAVELIWRDLRTGEILTRPLRVQTTPAAPYIPGPGMLPGTDNNPLPNPGTTPPPGVPLPPGAAPLPPPPVLVQSIAGFIPELGESITTAYQRNVNRLAVQIVSMMEKPW
jgi:hypothetical protein